MEQYKQLEDLNMNRLKTQAGVVSGMDNGEDASAVHYKHWTNKLYSFLKDKICPLKAVCCLAYTRTAD